uniref:Uncharacterized protein n=1 Tax=Ditylenchus dipsaci TaxID=166011 RepID=A0A915CU09_9BILA
MDSNPFEAELVRMFEVIEKAAEEASQIAIDRDLDLDLKTIAEIQSAASQIGSEGAETISENSTRCATMLTLRMLAAARIRLKRSGKHTKSPKE